MDAPAVGSGGNPTFSGNLKDENPGMSEMTTFTEDELDALETGGQVTNAADHSVYAAW